LSNSAVLLTRFEHFERLDLFDIRLSFLIRQRNQPTVDEEAVPAGRPFADNFAQKRTETRIPADVRLPDVDIEGAQQRVLLSVERLKAGFHAIDIRRLQLVPVLVKEAEAKDTDRLAGIKELAQDEIVVVTYADIASVLADTPADLLIPARPGPSFDIANIMPS